MNRRAKIVATIGPASQSTEVLRSLVEAGMDVARLNFSHGSHADHGEAIDRIRQIAMSAGRPVGVLQDLQGPRLRIGDLADEGPVVLEAGSTFELTTTLELGTSERVSVAFPTLAEDVKPGDTILMDGGQIELEVVGADNGIVHTKVIDGGPLRAKCGINLVGVTLSAPAVTEKDLDDLRFGLGKGVDAVALSFTRSAEDVQKLRDALEAEGKDLPIIAKLEHPESVEALEGILEKAEGVMVARGDLGVEVSPEKVPSMQKHIIKRANEAGRMVITATEMLDSMIRNPHPTRAESSDVANAVFDGSDALMLSGETAVGAYPLRSVQTMTRIISDAEAHADEWGEPLRPVPVARRDDAVATARAARKLAEDRKVAAVAVFTRTGRTAGLMAKARPHARIVAYTPETTTYARMTLLWGVEPRLCPMVATVEEMIAIVEDDLRQSLAGQQVVIVASLPVGQKGPPNFVYLRTLGN